jgi:hypothetical protein
MTTPKTPHERLPQEEEEGDDMFAAFENDDASDLDETSAHFMDAVLSVDQDIFADGYQSGLQAGALSHIADGARIGFQNG